MNSSGTIEPLPGLEAIIEELLIEEGYEFIISFKFLNILWALFEIT